MTTDSLTLDTLSDDSVRQLLEARGGRSSEEPELDRASKRSTKASLPSTTS